MAVQDKLIDHLIQIKNEGGSIKPSPQALKTLEEKIQGLPFALGTPAVLNLVNSGNMMSGILGMIGALTGLGDFGNIAQIVGKVAQAATQGGKSGSKPSTQQMVQMAQNTVPPDQLASAMGNVNALATSLFGSGNGAASGG